MRMSYNPAAHFLLFLVQWTDCILAGALGLLRVLIYKVYGDGTTTMYTHEGKASIRELYGWDQRRRRPEAEGGLLRGVKEETQGGGEQEAD